MELGMRLVSRDSGTTSGMSTATVVGIACGSTAAGLFLLSIVLFVIYWRRQHRFEIETLHRQQQARWSQGWDQWEESWPGDRAPRGPQYTMDYKTETGQAGTGNTSTMSQGNTLRVMAAAPYGDPDGPVSAMPAHPAYIPRGSVSASLAHVQRSAISPSTDVALVPLPPVHCKTCPDDALVQVYIDAADGHLSSSQQPDLLSQPAQSSAPARISPGLSSLASYSTHITDFPGLHQRTPSDAAPTSESDHHQRAPLSVRTSMSSWVSRHPTHGRPPRSHSRNERMLAGREDMTISAPLAFAEQASIGVERRPFRGRSESATRRLSSRFRRRSTDSSRVGDQTRGWEHAEREITIESDESDVYG